MSDSYDAKELFLSAPQKLNRIYGVWWDTINTGVFVALLTVCFLIFAGALMTGNLLHLPLPKVILENMAAQVSLERQAEIGIAILGVTVSGGSAAALFLIRQGTDRWAMNRRIGNFLLYFAQALHFRLSHHDNTFDDHAAVLRAFLQAALPLFESISDLHGAAQTRFELARLDAHRFLEGGIADQQKVVEIAVHLYCAALICRYALDVDVSQEGISVRVQEETEALLDFSRLTAFRNVTRNSE